MKLVKMKSLLGITAPLLIVAACSGGTSSSGEEPAIGEANAVEPLTTAIAGRVADGYLQGATVCVDINENGRCDTDEPQSLSGAGGTYSLDVPEDASDKPILAIVPATAIDEDTGEAIGKELYFSTPGDKPSFVSPITTLVHQELKKNPSLNTEDAEATVLETLGMPDEKDASLFTDYVANSETGAEELREKFQYLHQTARVVATMMGDIQENVEAAAVESGIDVSSDAETEAAIRRLVEDEVRSLLPEISAAVANQIAELRSEADTAEGTDTATHIVEIDPESISDSLVIEEVFVDIVDEIDAIKAENPIQPASMQEIMTAGFYILDVDCHVDEEYGPEDGIDEDVGENGAVILHDDGTPGRVEMPEYCEAEYSFITVNGEDNTLQEESYFYDATKARWVSAESFDDYDDKPHLLTLSGGEWVAVSEDGPSGPVEFTDDGGAVLKSAQGNMLVYATSRKLDDTAVLHHLKGRGANTSIAELVSSDALFSENSNVYKLHIKRDSKLTVLFNWYAEKSDDGIDYCAEFNGNCNVVGVRTDNGFSHYTSLASIQEGSVKEAVINEIIYDNDGKYGIDAKLEAIATETGASPDFGTVSWVVSKHRDVHNSEEHSEPYCEKVEPQFSQEQTETDQEYLEEEKLIDSSSDEYDKSRCENPMQEQYPDGTKNDDGELLQEETTAEDSEKLLAKSSWKTIVEDGVAMIEIELPVAIRLRMHQDEVASMLLVEHSGFVRRGARFSEKAVDDEVGYSEATFITLKPIIENYVSE